MITASVCLSVCLSVCQDIAETKITRAIFTIFFAVHVLMAVARSLLRQGNEIPIRGGAVFSPSWGSSALTMHCNTFAAKGITRLPTSCSRRDHSVAATFAANGIVREGGDGSAQRGRSVMYDCLTYSDAQFASVRNRAYSNLERNQQLAEYLQVHNVMHMGLVQIRLGFYPTIR